ncbi:LysR family transcriptional regulator [Xylophilus rhododendri]|uniref:LysR family transcriptional regulator n=1 Tax=Xylophilus rhododendri TaxID=2697032 RepID=A0A857J3M3_9BURK|nr:LysR family transcriptional regulator [Xylophilus rhododendri]QHI98356.1 LysR family transcriptional regulator [Xylophilus rhododendri]
MDALDDMRILVATVDAGGFTPASQRLGLSKQFVSRRVGALEERLGARLLQRTTRRLSVTELGRAYYERAVKIIEDVDEVENLVGNQVGPPRGTLRISAPMSFGTLHLAPVLARFLVEQPCMGVEVVLNDRMVDIVGEGFDMAIRIGVLADSSLVARAVGRTQLIACCSPGYIARHGAPATPRELSAHACLLYGHSRSVDWPFQVDGKPCDVAVTGRLLANNGELALAAARQDLGIALLPGFIVGDALDSGALVPVLQDFARPPIVVHAVYPQHRQASRGVQVFVELLARAFAGAEWQLSGR